MTKLFILFLFLNGCSSTPRYSYKDLEFNERTATDPKKPLTDDMVKADIDLAIYALNTAYSGRRFLPGNDFRDLASELHGIQHASTALELCQKIRQALKKVSDSHLDAWVHGAVCDLHSEDSGPGQVGKNIHSLTSPSWKVEIKKINRVSTLLIAITSFAQHDDPQWNGFIESVKENLSKAALVIIDMRGNGGGDDTKGGELATLLAGDHLKMPYSPQWESTTPESAQIILNDFEIDAWWDYSSKGLRVPEYLAKLISDYSDKRDLAVKNASSWKEDRAEKRSDFDPAKSIQKPIYILMDRHCASSCESTIDFFEYNPWVKKVGEHTGGYIHFGNNGFTLLKNSGIRMQMATAFNSYSDHRFLEKKGIAPDIVVTPGQDALQWAVDDYIKNKSIEATKSR